MRLQELLNKFTNAEFMITVDGMCEELSFYDYEEVKEHEYWKDYKNRKVKSMAIILTNECPELCIELEKE